jgi:hypothetical protein
MDWHRQMIKLEFMLIPTTAMFNQHIGKKWTIGLITGSVFIMTNHIWALINYRMENNHALPSTVDDTIHKKITTWNLIRHKTELDVTGWIVQNDYYKNLYYVFNEFHEAQNKCTQLQKLDVNGVKELMKN